MENNIVSNALERSHPNSLMINPSLVLQYAILAEEDPTPVIEAYSALLLNTPLPNGELPLHFAVRKNKPDVVITLLTHGADTEKKDYQGLTAIEHAVLLQNEEMVARILGHKIGASLEDVQGQIACKGTASHAARLKQKVQLISYVNRRTLDQDKKNAYEGRPELLQSETLGREGNAHLIDDKGFSLIHYAILGGHADLVEGLVQQFAIDVNTVNKEGDSLLHFAAISGSSEVIEKLIALGAGPNVRNHNGETALHYAAALEKLSVLQALVKGGSDPTLCDNENVSPLALVGAAAHQKDPLAVSKNQYILFGINALFWLATLSRMNNGTLAQQWQEELKIIANALFTASALAGFGFAVQSSKASKGAIGEMAFRNLVVTPLLSHVLGVFSAQHVIGGTVAISNVYGIANSTFRGLKACWNNLGYRNWTVARNAVILTANTGQSLFSLVWTVGKIIKNLPTGPQKAGVDPSKLKNLSAAERVLHSELDPKDIESALKMVDPDFTIEKLESTGKPLYEKPLRNLNLKFHPDKCFEDNCTAVFSRLTLAKTTIENYLGLVKERSWSL